MIPTTIPFRGMVLLRKCLVSHHSSKAVMSFPVKEALRLTQEGLVETWGSGLLRRKGDWESSPSL